MAALAVVGTVSPAFSGLVTSFTMAGKDSVQATTTTSAAPAITIKPLSVRPVLTAFVTTPEECPAPAPTPADKPIRVCDITKKAVYELSPEAMQVELTKVESFRNPLTGVQMVQMSMTEDSARQFGEFTAGQVGKQVAFVRGSTVVWGPKITTPIEGQVLQLSGDLTTEQADEVAGMLGEKK